MKDWHDILKTCELQNWREALAAVITYAQPEEFSSLCGGLKVTGRQPCSVSINPHSQTCFCVFSRPSGRQTGGSGQRAAAGPGLPLLHLRWKHRKTGVLLERRPGWTPSPVPSGRPTGSSHLCISNCACSKVYAELRLSLRTWWRRWWCCSGLSS